MLRKCCLIVLLALFPLPFPLPAGAATESPWVFFDLGRTLINHTRDYSRMRYLPGALEYARGLKKHGFHLGLLINWPENEGHGNAEKLRLLREFIEPKWTDKVPFDWSLFEAVLFPPKDIWRKPHPYLFIEALRTAAPQAVVYQGEDREEIQVAREMGLTAHCVTPASGSGRLPLLSADEITARIRSSFIYQHPGSGE